MRSLSLVLGAMVLVACGGTTETTTDGGNTGMDGSMQGGDSSTGMDSGGGMDSGMMNQDSGGGTSTPGKIDCGMMSCMAGTEVCCIRGGGFSDAGPMYSCQPPQMTCQGARIGCDEAADCMMGSVCCGGITGMNGFGSRCSMMGQTMCGMGSVQLCKTNQECGNMGTCTTWTCPFIGKVTSCTKPFMNCM